LLNNCVKKFLTIGHSIFNGSTDQVKW
jgi:hypothetical protein